MLLAAVFTHFLAFLWKASKSPWLWSSYLSFSIYVFSENGGEHRFTVSVMQSGYFWKRREQNQTDSVFATWVWS